MSTHTNRPISIKALFIIFLGACFYFYDFVLQVSPGIMVGSIRHSFAINATTLGMVMGSYYYAYTFFQIPAGLFLDRFGAKRVLTVVILVCAAGGFIFAFAPSIYFLALGRMFMGAGSAFAFLGALYLCLRWLRPALFAVFVGLTQMLGSLGAAFATAPLALIVHHMGWRGSMILFACLGMLLALAVFLFVKRPIWNTKVHNSSKRQATKGMLQAFKTALKHKQSYTTALYAMMIWAPIATFSSLWGVPFLKSAYQLSTLQASSAVASTWIAMALACPLVGMLSERLQRRSIILAGAAALGLISVLLLIYDQGLSLTAIYLCLIGMGIAAAGQSLSFAVIKDNQPLHLTGAANGFNNMCVVLGGALFQPLVGKLLDANWTGTLIHGARHYGLADFQHALILLPIFYAVATLTALFLVKETYCKPTFKS